MAGDRTNWPAVCYGLGLSVLAAYQLFKLPPALPVLLEAHGYDRTLAGGLMSVYALAGLAVSIKVGRRLERADPRPLVLLGLALFGAGNLLVLVLTPTGPAMLAARAMEGLGFAILALAGPLMANRAAAARHLSMVVAATAAWIPAGQILAILAAAGFLDRFGWPFLWNLGLAATLALALLLPLAGGRESPGTGGAAAPPAPLDGPARRGLWLGAGVFMLWSCQFFAFMTWLPQFLTEAVGLGLSAALAGYLLPVGVLLAFNLLAGAMLRRGWPVGLLMAGALLLQALVWWLHPRLGDGPAGAILLVVYGIGAGITPTCLFALPSRLGGREGAARAFGALMTGRNVGVLVGPILLAQAVGAAASWSVSGPLFGGLTLLAVCLAGWLAFIPRAAAVQGTRR